MPISLYSHSATSWQQEMSLCFIFILLTSSSNLFRKVLRRCRQCHYDQSESDVPPGSRQWLQLCNCPQNVHVLKSPTVKTCIWYQTLTVMLPPSGNKKSVSCHQYYLVTEQTEQTGVHLKTNSASRIPLSLYVKTMYVYFRMKNTTLNLGWT